MMLHRNDTAPPVNHLARPLQTENAWIKVNGALPWPACRNGSINVIDIVIDEHPAFRIGKQNGKFMPTGEFSFLSFNPAVKKLLPREKRQPAKFEFKAGWRDLMQLPRAPAADEMPGQVVLSWAPRLSAGISRF